MQTGNSRRYTELLLLDGKGEGERGKKGGKEKRKKKIPSLTGGLIVLSFIDETSSNDNHCIELEGQVRVDELLTNGARTCSYCFDRQLFTPCIERTNFRVYIYIVKVVDQFSTVRYELELQL